MCLTWRDFSAQHDAERVGAAELHVEAAGTWQMCVARIWLHSPLSHWQIQVKLPPPPLLFGTQLQEPAGWSPSLTMIHARALPTLTLRSDWLLCITAYSKILELLWSVAAGCAHPYFVVAGGADLQCWRRHSSVWRHGWRWLLLRK